MNINILGIESSCDDTSASIIQNGVLLANVIANQEVHQKYGGVVPELASRAHQQNIIPVVQRALEVAQIGQNELNAIAFTRGPGLLGSLLVGVSFAKGFSIAKNIPLIEVNHLQAHILSLFLKEKDETHAHPKFPFLCLLVSGGHTQIVVVKDYFEMEIIAETIDDAAGEAFDKCAKVMGLPYPGGPEIDRLSQTGNPVQYKFTKPRVKDKQFSFSGLKTAFLYFLRDSLKVNSNFIEENKTDLCASIQHTIVDILMDKLKLAAKKTGIKEIAIAGGVSANSGLQKTLLENAKKHRWQVYIPKLKYSTDNAAMVAITGYYKYLKKDFVSLEITPQARMALTD